MKQNLTDKEKIRISIRNMVKDMIPTPFAWGTVESVDEDKMLAVCKDSVSDLEYHNVVLSLGSIVPIPSTGSQVLLGLTSVRGEASFIVWAEKIKKHTLIMENGFKIELKDDGTMTMNGTNLDGLAVVGKIAEKLNNVEKDINSLKQAFSSWGPVANDGGAALKTATTDWFGQQLKTTDKSDLENKKIKHGN